MSQNEMPNPLASPSPLPPPPPFPPPSLPPSLLTSSSLVEETRIVPTTAQAPPDAVLSMEALDDSQHKIGSSCSGQDGMPSTPSRSLVVVNNGDCRILFMDPLTLELTDSINFGTGYCVGLSIYKVEPASDEGMLAVSDSSSHCVKVFNLKSKILLRTFLRKGRGLKPGELYLPYNICLTRSPTDAGVALIVSNAGGHRIDVFDVLSGMLLRSMGSKGKRPGQLDLPGAIVVWTPLADPTNPEVIVADHNNNRLQFFSLSSGLYLRSAGVAGPDAGQIYLPWALTLHCPAHGTDEDAMVVTIGTTDCRVHVFSVLTGDYLRCIGSGKGPGRDQLTGWIFGVTIYRPADLDEEETRVIISVKDRDILQVYNLRTGEYVDSITVPNGGVTNVLKGPAGIAVEGQELDAWSYVMK